MRTGRSRLPSPSAHRSPSIGGRQGGGLTTATSRVPAASAAPRWKPSSIGALFTSTARASIPASDPVRETSISSVASAVLKLRALFVCALRRAAGGAPPAIRPLERRSRAVERPPPNGFTVGRYARLTRARARGHYCACQDPPKALYSVISEVAVSVRLRAKASSAPSASRSASSTLTKSVRPP